jgi:excisionase family DNA binding protein
MIDPMTAYLTTEEVAELLRTTPETVRYWRHVGKGPKSFKIGRRVLYANEDVDSFIADARASSSGNVRASAADRAAVLADARKARGLDLSVRERIARVKNDD